MKAQVLRIVAALIGIGCLAGVTFAEDKPASTDTAAVADASLSERVDAYIRSQMEAQRIPGLALAVVKDGKVVHAKGYGLANIEHQVPVTTHTVFQSGSVGKQFTAALVLMLAEDGKLRIDDPVTKYIDGLPASWKDITIRHLLTHTAGLPDFPYDKMDMRKDYSDEELVRLAAALPLAAAPGERWSYSNAGYVLLGILANRVSGKFYGDLLAERIFRPLGMETARIISEADIIPNRAGGYQLVNGQRKNQDWVAPILNRTADGSLYWTIEDLIKWDAALAEHRLLSEESYRQMWAPAKLNNGQATEYGFGWFIRKRSGHAVIEHNGAWQGFASDIARYIDDRLTVILLANQAGTKLDPIEHEVARFYVPALADRSAEHRTK